MKFLKTTMLLLLLICLYSCGPAKQISVATFPPSDEIFLTSGDGDIQKPYTPVGELIIFKSAKVIPIPVFSLIILGKPDADEIIRNEVVNQIRNKGGDGLINMKINIVPSRPGIIGNSVPGYVFISGTIVKR